MRVDRRQRGPGSIDDQAAIGWGEARQDVSCRGDDMYVSTFLEGGSCPSVGGQTRQAGESRANLTGICGVGQYLPFFGVSISEQLSDSW